MYRFLFCFFIAGALVACSKIDKPGSSNDSLLVKPMNADPVPEAQAPKDTANGLLIDQARFRSPEHEKLLERFQPSEVVRIYHDFKPLRKPGTKEEQIEKFTKDKKINKDELKAVLEEGDRLGWSK